MTGQPLGLGERTARPAQLLLFQTDTKVTVREECLGRGACLFVMSVFALGRRVTHANEEQGRGPAHTVKV